MARRCAVSCRLMVACRRNCPAVAGRVKAKILVCHGNDDPFVPAEHVASLIAEMNEAGADWQFITTAVPSTASPTQRPTAAAFRHSSATSFQMKAMLDLFDEILA